MMTTMQMLAVSGADAADVVDCFIDWKVKLEWADADDVAQL